MMSGRNSQEGTSYVEAYRTQKCYTFVKQGLWQLQRVRTLGQQLQEARARSQNDNQMLTQALYDEANERRVWWLRTQRVERRNHILLQEKVGLRLINRRHKAEADLAEFNRAWVFNRYQKWKALEINSRQIILNLQINPPNMATMIHVNKLVTPPYSTIPFYDGQEEPESYYAKLRNINELARPLAVAGFDALVRTNKMREKMTGRFHPVPVNNPYNGNAPINNEAEFLNWLQGKYREVMVGTNQDALRSLMNEKFSTMDTADTYEKRIKTYAQGIPYADVLPYLYSHMSQYMEMRLRQANPANLDAFFTNLRQIWLECRGKIAEQAPPPSQALTTQSQKDDFKIRLARDLQYTGIATDDATLEQFIYDDLQKKLGSRIAHVRKSPFKFKSINKYPFQEVIIKP